jgi:hypothetical protein
MPARPTSPTAERFAHVDMVQAARSPGSALKPFLYGLALDDGLIHSESLLADVPQSFAGYQPGNFQAELPARSAPAKRCSDRSTCRPSRCSTRLGPRSASSRSCGAAGSSWICRRRATANLSVILGGAGRQPGRPGRCLQRAGARRRQPASRAILPMRRWSRIAHDERRCRLHHSRRPRIRRPGGANGRWRHRQPPWHRLEDRYQLRLSRCLGGRRDRSLHAGVWVGGPTERPTPASSAPTSRPPCWSTSLP